MTENVTTVGSSEGEENSLTLYGVAEVKPGTVNTDGRLYIGTRLSGEYVRYALIGEQIFSSLGSAEDRTVVMNDVEKIDNGKVLSNGALYVGSEYAGQDVSCAVTVIDSPEEREEKQNAVHS